jgi:hypothetical protein
MPAPRALRQIRLDFRRNMANRLRAPGDTSSKTGRSEPPEGGTPGVTKTGLRQTAAHHHLTMRKPAESLPRAADFASAWLRFRREWLSAHRSMLIPLGLGLTPNPQAPLRALHPPECAALQAGSRSATQYSEPRDQH